MKRVFALTAWLVLQCSGIQVNQILQKQRGQLLWRQEATNTFTWNATQELKWSVVNAFTDVQTSPDGDVYAIQKISSEVSPTRYQLYFYNIEQNIWNLVSSTFDIKAVRFDRLGNIYYLDSDSCVRNELKETLICGVSDFEVTVEKKIFALVDDSGILPQFNSFQPARVSPYQYKALSGYKGITLIKDEPILISNDGTVDATYGSEKLVSISAGIDGSLWALQDQAGSSDYTLLKWQTVAKRWYKVEGAKGISLSAYNEISVALVNSLGLLSLSSQVDLQDEAQYLPTTEQQLAIDNQEFGTESKLATTQDISWIAKQIPDKSFDFAIQVFGLDQDQENTVDQGIVAYQNRQNLIMLYKTDYGVVSGFYLEQSYNKFSSQAVQSPGNMFFFSLSQREVLNPQVYSKGAMIEFNAQQGKVKVSSDKITMQFSPQCDGIHSYEDYFYRQQPTNSIANNTILTGNPDNDDTNVRCQRIEYYILIESQK